jgi:hypothetical protein
MSGVSKPGAPATFGDLKSAFRLILFLSDAIPSPNESKISQTRHQDWSHRTADWHCALAAWYHVFQCGQRKEYIN